MSRLKRLLALTICLLLTITSLPVTQLVFAKETDIFSSITYAYREGTAGDIKETVTKNGRECIHWGRAASGSAFIQFNIKKDLLEDGALIVAEFPIVFGETLDRMHLNGTSSEEYVKLDEADSINVGDWNDVRIEWTNVKDETGKYYINNILANEFKVSSTLVSNVSKNGYIRIFFKDDVDPIGTSKEAWIDENGLKVTQIAGNVVKYYNINNEVIDTKTVADGGKAESVAAPSVEHYDFLGWYAKDASTPFDFDTSINGSLDLYAKYEAKTYDVVFKANGATVETLSGKYGEAVNGIIPEIPEVNGKFALGWFIGDTNEEFTATTPVTGPDMVVNAKYSDQALEEYTVTFNVDGTVYDTKTVYDGYTVTLPENPSKEDHIFTGWKLEDGTDFTEASVVKGNINVYATWKSDGNIVLDEDITKYTSLTGNNVDFIINPSANTSATFDNGLKFAISESRPTERKFENVITGVFKIPVGEYDSVNKTQVYNSSLPGEYQVDITFDVKLAGEYTAEDGTSVKEPFGYITTGMYADSAFTNLLLNRLRSSYAQSFNSGAVNSNTFNQYDYDDPKKNGKETNFTYPGFADGKADNVTLQIKYDTIAKKAYMTMVGADGYAIGAPYKEVPYVNAFQITLMNAFRLGDYVKIKRVKVKEINNYSEGADYEALQSIVDSLPDSLVSNPDDASGTANLPVIDGVKWSSSDEDAVSSETGAITKSFDDKEVVVTANVTSGIYTMSKEYKLTVKRNNKVKLSFYMDKELTELFQESAIEPGTAYGELPVPEEAGAIFLGWKKADGTDFTAETVVSESTDVYATWEITAEVIFEEDLTKYTSLTGNNVEFITSKIAASKTYLDGGVKFGIVNSQPSIRKFNDILYFVYKIPVGEYDEENRTQVYNTNLAGDYEYEYKFDINLTGGKYTADDGTSVSETFAMFCPGAYKSGSFSAILNNRVRNGKIETYNVNSADLNSFNSLPDDHPKKTGSTTGLEYPDKKNVVVKVRYDSVTGNTTMEMVGFEDVAFGTPAIQTPYINGFSLQLMNCSKNGDYINVKNVKVTRYNDYSDAPEHKADYEKLYDILDSLPASIVADPRNVTGDITFEEIDGVDWSSSNEEVISSITGKVNRTYNDEEVVVTATVKSGIYTIAKEYELTVLKDSRVEIKDIINQNFTSEDTIGNWSFINLDDTVIGGYEVDENGIKISKLTSVINPDAKNETKRYFAFYDLYQEVASDDYSVTEIKDVKGVYDVTIDMSKYSTSKVPMNVAIGCRDGLVFYNYGILKIDSQSAKFVNYKTAEAFDSTKLEISDNAKITFRVDTTAKTISLIVDGEILIDRVPYYTALDENAGINAVKVEIDSNNNIGDYINVKNITVTQLIKEDFAELEELIAAAADVDVYDITETPTDVSDKIKVLPEKVGNYNIVWTSLSSQIDIDTRKVFFDSEAKKVYVTAEIYDENAQYPFTVKKIFELTVRKAASDKELDEFKINSLGKITNQDYDDIRYDLNLPTVDGITWKSSNESLITNDGKIVDDAVVTEETTVTITAKTKNNVTKDYVLKVKPRTGKVVLAKGNAPVTITLGDVADAKVSSDVAVSFTYTDNNKAGKVNVLDENGSILVSMVADNKGIHFDYLGSDYKKYDVESANVEIIVMPDVDKAAIFVDGKIVADYVSLKNNADYVAKVESEINAGEITMFVDKYGMLNANFDNLDNLDYFADVKYGYANAEGLNLPTNVLTNAVATWSSSNTAILSNTGAVVKTPVSMTFVDLKFVLKEAENSEIFVEKTFKIAVDCDSSRNMIYNKIADVKFKNPDYPQENMTDNDAKTAFRVLNANTADFDIVFNLKGEKVFNSLYVLNTDLTMEDYEIYSSVDGESWHLITSGNMNGEVSKLVEFTNTTASFVKFVVKKCEAPFVHIGEMKVFFGGTDLELAQYDIENVVIDVAPTGTKINLPEVGANGTKFTWASSNEDVIDKDGNITRPSSATTVTLTVNVDGQELSRTFDVYVDTKSSSGPSQVGGGSGGGGGAGSGMASGGSANVPVIGEAEEDTVYSEDLKPVESTASVYNDVKETDWYFGAVKTLTSKGIVSGDGTGYFYPTNNVTREQFVKMILEAIDVEITDADHSFADVASGSWYEDYIATAVSNGIVNGVGGGNFGVGTNITRQDMAVLIERVLTYKNIEVAKEEVEPFADTAEVADYAKDAVSNMKAIGLIQGYNNNYNPKDNLTRAEAATVIASLLELLAK